MTREQIEILLGGIPLPIILVGADQRIFASNDRARALFGQQIQGRHHATVLRHPVLLEAIDRALQQGLASDVRLGLTQGAAELQFRLCASAIPDAGAPALFAALISLEDMTLSEQAEQIRRDFVANVSHELRTPLTALMGFIETLQGAARHDPVAQARFLEIMAREAGRMNRLVSDLLSLSRVEAEERMRPALRVDAVALVQSSILALRALAQGQGVDLELTGDTSPAMVQADPDQFHQVMQNLIENAVKYGGPDRRVTINLRHDPRDPNLSRPCLVIEVVDRGDGIDEEHLPRLTERFYRVDSHRSRDKGGTGLGLAIVKHIVARHRGRLRIESVPGQGSRFSVILPIA